MKESVSTCKHKYINEKKVRYFPKYLKAMSVEKIADDILGTYKIKNMSTDYELALFDICQTLYDDIHYERCNYKAYIEENMDLRMLMALRTIAVLPLGEGFNTAYQECSTCNTPKDVREVRIKYLKKLNKEYEDLDWQYYYIAKRLMGKRGIGFIFDYEYCYENCTGSWTDPEMYMDSLIWNCTPPGLYKSDYSGRHPWKAHINVGDLNEDIKLREDVVQDINKEEELNLWGF